MCSLQIRFNIQIWNKVCEPKYFVSKLFHLKLSMVLLAKHDFWSLFKINGNGSINLHKEHKSNCTHIKLLTKVAIIYRPHRYNLRASEYVKGLSSNFNLRNVLQKAEKSSVFTLDFIISLYCDYEIFNVLGWNEYQIICDSLEFFLVLFTFVDSWLVHASLEFLGKIT